MHHGSEVPDWTPVRTAWKNITKCFYAFSLFNIRDANMVGQVEENTYGIGKI